jgi:hypothetical protein
MKKRNLIIIFCFFVIFIVIAYTTLSFPTYLKPADNGAKEIIIPDDYSTLSDAIANATEGTTIYLRQGNYSMTESVLEINKTLTIIGEDQAKTIINSSPDTRYGFELLNPKIALQINADNSKISNLTITNSDYGVYVTGNNSQVYNITTKSIYVVGSDNTISQNNLSLTMGFYSGYLFVEGSFNNITDNHLINYLHCSGNFNNIIENSGATMIINGTSNFVDKNSFVDSSIE